MFLKSLNEIKMSSFLGLISLLKHFCFDVTFLFIYFCLLPVQIWTIVLPQHYTNQRYQTHPGLICFLMSFSLLFKALWG